MSITLINDYNDDDLNMIDNITCNFGVRVGSFVANGMKKYYINDENVGYTLTYVTMQNFDNALDAIYKAYEDAIH